MFKCDRCGYNAKSKRQNLIRHLKKKNICPSTYKDIPREELLVIYDNNSNHRKVFYKITKIETNDNEVDMDKLQRENMELLIERENLLNKIKNLKEENKKLEIDKSAMTKQIDSLINKVGNNTNNVYNIFQLNEYGKEDISYISDNYFEDILNNPDYSITELVKHIHFNPEHPENMNIKITNKNKPYASIYNNKGWKIVDRKEIIYDLVRKGFTIIKDKVINEPMLCDKKYQMFKKNTNRKTKEILRNTDILVMNNSLGGYNNLLKNSL